MTSTETNPEVSSVQAESLIDSTWWYGSRSGENNSLSNWRRGVDPLDFALNFDDALRWYGVPNEFVTDRLDCREPLSIDGSEDSALRPYYLQTNSVDSFKELIGVPNRYIREGRITPPEPRSLKFDPRMEDPNAALTAAEHETIELAAEVFLFGDSDEVDHFRTAIELHLGPFRLAVYSARQIELYDTGSLTLSGPPSVLISEQVDINNGSSLITKTVTRVLTDHLVKQCDFQSTPPFSASATRADPQCSPNQV